MCVCECVRLYTCGSTQQQQLTRETRDNETSLTSSAPVLDYSNDNNRQSDDNTSVEDELSIATAIPSSGASHMTTHTQTAQSDDIDLDTSQINSGHVHNRSPGNSSDAQLEMRLPDSNQPESQPLPSVANALTPIPTGQTDEDSEQVAVADAAINSGSTPTSAVYSDTNSNGIVENPATPQLFAAPGSPSESTASMTPTLSDTSTEGGQGPDQETSEFEVESITSGGSSPAAAAGGVGTEEQSAAAGETAIAASSTPATGIMADPASRNNDFVLDVQPAEISGNKTLVFLGSTAQSHEQRMKETGQFPDAWQAHGMQVKKEKNLALQVRQLWQVLILLVFAVNLWYQDASATSQADHDRGQSGRASGPSELAITYYFFEGTTSLFASGLVSLHQGHSSQYCIDLPPAAESNKSAQCSQRPQSVSNTTDSSNTGNSTAACVSAQPWPSPRAQPIPSKAPTCTPPANASRELRE